MHLLRQETKSTGNGLLDLGAVAGIAVAFTFCILAVAVWILSYRRGRKSREGVEENGETLSFIHLPTS